MMKRAHPKVDVQPIFKNALTQFTPQLTQFMPITLGEMNAVSLQDRLDTKYIFGSSQLATLLPSLAQAYRVLTIDGRQLNLYQTLYFDTRHFEFYRQHHNGIATRYKVRERTYKDSNLSFIEVKHHTNQGRTVKSRLQIPNITYQMDAPIDDFVEGLTPFSANALEPKFWNEYMRITLVNHQQTERVTLDINLLFEWENQYCALPGIVIAEVKQAKMSRQSPFIQLMRHHHIRAGGVSKYCVGAAMLYDGLKSNNFKPSMQRLNYVIQKELNHA